MNNIVEVDFLLKKICLYCGVEDSVENPVIENICLKCRAERGVLIRISNEIVFEICRLCYSIKNSFKWIETTSIVDALEYIVYKKLPSFIEKPSFIKSIRVERYEFLTNPSWRTRIRVYLSIQYGMHTYTIFVETTVVFKSVKCSKCIIVSSGEYSAVVQIRDFNKNYFKAILENVMNKNSFVNNIIDIVEKQNGYDIIFYSKSSARKFVKTLFRNISGRYNVIVRESFEHVSSKRGVSRYRLVISVKAKE